MDHERQVDQLERSGFTNLGVIVFGPSGCGKSTHATALALYFGKTRIVDDWVPGGPVPADTLALTSTPCGDSIRFDDAIVLARAGAAINQDVSGNPGAGQALVEQLMNAAFRDNPTRTPRSGAYQLGVRSLLEHRARLARLACPYRAGTAEFDAFYSGVDEGNTIWSRHAAAIGAEPV